MEERMFEDRGGGEEKRTERENKINIWVRRKVRSN
jgi:hypothetical protein